MAEVTNELIYEVLKRVQQDVADVKQAQRETAADLITIRKSIGRIDTHLGAIEEDMANLAERMNRADERIARIERRLDIVDDPVL